MEQSHQMDQNSDADAEDPLLTQFRKRVKAISAPQPDGAVNVSLNRRDDWFILNGSVRSPQLKARLISIVPQINGEQRIVDKLRIGNPHKPN